MLKIVISPNPILSKKAKEVKRIDKSILKVLDGMSRSLLSAKDPVGVGLAAPQVGYPLRIFLLKPEKKSPIQVIINPKIIHISSEKIQKVFQSQRTENIKEKSSISNKSMLEGCLSLINIWGEVQRQKEIKLTYLNELGAEKTKLFTGFSAIIVQHEIDHLNGILFPKRVLEQKGKLYKSQKNEKGEDVFEEIEI